MTSSKRRFLGTTSHPVDKKGRMSISTRLQTALDVSSDDDGTPRRSGVLCVDPHEGECLWVFNDDGFDREMERFDRPALSGDAATGARFLDDQRDFFEWVTTFTLDTSGRLVIPERFRTLVGIEGTAVAAGMNSRLEIWAEGRWENRRRGKHSPLTDSSGLPRADRDGGASGGASQQPSQGGS